MYYSIGDNMKHKKTVMHALKLASNTINRPYWTAHVNRYKARLETIMLGKRIVGPRETRIDHRM